MQKPTKNQGAIWNNPKVRSVFFQALLIAVLAWLVMSLLGNALHNMEIRGISTGFDFLEQKSGFDILFSLIEYSSESSYGQTFVVGLINTVLVSAIGIIFATIIGFIVGVARLSSNWLVAKIALVYVETFRNIPLLLQILFWYAMLKTNLPLVKNSLDAFGVIFLSNRGLYMPAPVLEDSFIWVFVAFIISLIICFFMIRRARKIQVDTGKRVSVFWVNFGTIIVITGTAFAIFDAPMHLDYIEKGRFNMKGGMSIIPELMTMVIALSIYTGTFIAETVRSGILAVNKGQKEAARALGLRPRRVLSLVVIPQAMRVIIPQLTSQYLNLTKNSSLSIAIGYPDLFAVFAGTALNQSGRAIETIVLTMAVYLTLSLTISMFMNWYNARNALVER